MKRCFSMALILALLGTTAVTPASAEELEIVSENVVDFVAELESVDASLLYEDLEEAPRQTFEDITDDAAQNAVDDASVNQDGEQPASDIELSAKSIAIGVNEKYRDLKVISLPVGKSTSDICWRSSDKKVAKVSKAGVVTGVSRGSATIYAKISGEKKEVKCKVTVKKAPKKAKISPSSLSLGAGASYQLKPSVPSGYASGSFTYKSSKPKVASVDKTGVITARKEGSATITVKTYNGRSVKCKVKVLGEPAAVVFAASVVPVAVGQTVSLNASAVTENDIVVPSVITYAIDDGSPDPDCVILNESTGKIQGVRKGQALICATAQNGVVGYCQVEVDVAPASISMNLSKASIGVKEVYAGLLVDLTPPKGEVSCAQNVVWTSSNSKVAKVDSSTGVITGVKKGSCTIKAKAPGGKTATCKITVLKAPSKGNVSISPGNGSLEVGQSGTYNVTFDKGYGGSLSYESSNPDIASIDSTGIVTAISPGKTVISVTVYNGVTKTASLQVKSSIEDESDYTGDSDGSKSGSDEKIQYIIKIAKEKLGKPYVYGSFGPNSFDCSGFVYWCFMQINIKLKDSAYKQGYDERYPKIDYDDLRAGDLVFFNTVNDKDLSDHSGLYLGGGQFIHASSSAKKVIISSMKSGYYKRNFSWGRRVLN